MLSKQAQSALETFLARADLKGSEVEKFQNLVKELSVALSHKCEPKTKTEKDTVEKKKETKKSE